MLRKSHLQLMLTVMILLTKSRFTSIHRNEARKNSRTVDCFLSLANSNKAVGGTGQGACCHENTQCRAERKWGSSVASLDEIAAGFYVGITKINWILVICSECDSVMESYEPDSALKPTSYRLDPLTQLTGKHWSNSTVQVLPVICKMIFYLFI